MKSCDPVVRRFCFKLRGVLDGLVPRHQTAALLVGAGSVSIFLDWGWSLCAPGDTRFCAPANAKLLLSALVYLYSYQVLDCQWSPDWRYAGVHPSPALLEVLMPRA
jgi:hypothetical protein